MRDESRSRSRLPGGRSKWLPEICAAVDAFGASAKNAIETQRRILVNVDVWIRSFLGNSEPSPARVDLSVTANSQITLCIQCGPKSRPLPKLSKNRIKSY